MATPSACQRNQGTTFMWSWVRHAGQAALLAGIAASLLACAPLPPHIPLNNEVDTRDARYVARRRAEQQLALEASIRGPQPGDAAFVRQTEALRSSLFPFDNRGRRDGIFYARNNRLQGYYNRRVNIARGADDARFLSQQQALSSLRGLTAEQRRERELEFLAQQERLQDRAKPRLSLAERSALFQENVIPPPDKRPGANRSNDADFLSQQQNLRAGYDDHLRRTAEGFEDASGQLDPTRIARYNQRLNAWRRALSQTGRSVPVRQPATPAAAAGPAGAPAQTAP